jgi:acyl carrier protein
MTNLTKVLAIVESLEVLPDVTAFDPARSFKDNGIDSLDVMNLFLEVEETFNTKFTEEELLEIHTVNDLLKELNARGL